MTSRTKGTGNARTTTLPSSADEPTMPLSRAFATAGVATERVHGVERGPTAAG
ncbi:hypothetical protein Amsp01_041680 [Amycolatopsis sp. NBRC 101858]|uniref:hypothetical protein n=1 Tax=Amycolatopsis sp. NBRC 101858 TaxID=3032200 RepID=UPI0024A0228E|nr:hypothetical protein [Amycolatopsis sp. NBRC 101858]GLY38144.1 hypothetical protein Amsp01_041680 [Amycolatopsis sp. NBRC 101858]